MNLEVKKDETTNKWGLYVNGTLLGDSKNRFDADHAKRIIELSSKSNK